MIFLDNNILTFHRISKNINNAINTDPLSVSQKNFENQIILLKKKFNIIPLEKFLQFKKNNSKKNIVITFDDGYKDNLVNALPILNKHKVPATIYITTKFLSKDCSIWWYEIKELIWKKSSLKFKFFQKNFNFNLKSISDKKKCYEILCKEFKKLNYKKQNLLLEIITNNKKRKQYKKELLNKNELKLINKNKLITIGSHTHNHLSLKNISKKECEQELAKPKKILEKILKHKINHFAYPYGSFSDVSNKVAKLVQDENYKSASTTQINFIEPNKKFLLPRIYISNRDLGFILLIKLSWFYKLYYLIKKNLNN